MTVEVIRDLLEAEVLTDTRLEGVEISAACGSDLMSDVLAFVKNQAMLLTGLVNPQVVRTAEMMDMNVIVFVRGKRPTPQMLDLANEKGMIIMTTEFPMFVACGRLYQGGLRGRGE